MTAQHKAAQQPDEFLEALQRTYRYVLENIKMVSVIVGGILGGIVIILFVFSQMKTARLQETSLLNQAVAAYHEGNLEDSLSVLQKFSGKKGLNAVSAELYQGNIYYDRGEYENALTHFDKARELSSGMEDSLVKGLALQGIAYSEKALGRLDRAAEAFAQLAGNFKDLSLLELGRIYSEQGEKEKALEVLDQLIADFPDSPWISSANLLKEELNL